MTPFKRPYVDNLTTSSSTQSVNKTNSINNKISVNSENVRYSTTFNISLDNYLKIKHIIIPYLIKKDPDKARSCTVPNVVQMLLEIEIKRIEDNSVDKVRYNSIPTGNKRIVASMPESLKRPLSLAKSALIDLGVEKPSNNQLLSAAIQDWES